LIFEWYVSLDLLHLLLYINNTQHYNQLTLERFFYQARIQSTFNEKNKDNSNDDNDDNHVQDVLASNQHQLLVPMGMNCTPRYQVDFVYAQGMLIMHKPCVSIWLLIARHSASQDRSTNNQVIRSLDD
jgi:hypothetical protein